MTIIKGNFGLIKGKLPDGCKLCINGMKSVVFITGFCTWPAWCSHFCPLSKTRRNKETIFVNEKKIDLSSLEMAIKEIKNEIILSKSTGASITGGEPLLVFKRTLWMISLLKKEFGKKFHIHLYTNGDLLSEEKIKLLANVGLDEIRLHSYDKAKIYLLKKAKNFGLRVGLEYPLSPFLEKVIKSRILIADKLELDFVNLNEFEVTEDTYNWFRANKLIVNSNGISVKGSNNMAKKILSWSVRNTKNISVHYCPFWVKDSVQYRNRLILRAKGIRKKHEKITTDGTIIKAVLVPQVECEVRNETMVNNLKKLFSKYNDYMFIDALKDRIEFNFTLLENEQFFKELSETIGICYKIAIVEELPTHPGSELNIFYIQKRPKNLLENLGVRIIE